jgi:hypothetical protein
VTTMTHEEALAHFGVKGMHWGQRKAETSGSGGSGGGAGSRKPPKPTRNDILTARAMQRHLADKSWDIHDKLVSATTEHGRLAAAKELQKNADAWDSANAVAKRRTGGEKVGLVLAWSALAVVTTARIAVAVGGNKRL